MVNGHIGLATQNHADRTNELIPIWKSGWVWTVLAVVAATFF